MPDAENICVRCHQEPEIVHQANLSVSMADPNIYMLTKNRMLYTRKESRVVSQTTTKGKELLKDYKKIESEIWGDNNPQSVT